MYTTEELKKILARTAGILDVEVDDESLTEMARRSRGTPRVANRMLKRIRDFSQVRGNGIIDIDITREGLNALGVDELGLERIDREILRAIIERFNGGPVGLDTLAAATGEDATTIEDVYEPYLLQLGFISKNGDAPCIPAFRHSFRFCAMSATNEFV